MRQLFHHCSIFLRDLGSGRGGTVSIRNSKLPDVPTTEPWDGKDGEVGVARNFIARYLIPCELPVHGVFRY